MAGLETILSQIIQEAQASAENDISQARAQAEKIIADAKIEGNKKAEEILKNTRAAVEEIKNRTDSSTQLIERNQRLVAKQRLISETISDVLKELENAPDEEYFGYLIKLYARFAQPGKCEMRLNSRDLSRLPKNFEKSLKSSCPKTEAAISRLPENIDGGFVLDYGGIDVNCSFKAVFEANLDLLHDAVSKTLFTDQTS